MQAVILAAGMGVRIRNHHTLPKGFIRLDKNPIIIESLQKLKQQDIKDILIVTGYGSEHYENLAKNDHSITTRFNEKYSDSGSLYSLYCARDWIKDDFLLLESDLVFEDRAIHAICHTLHSNSILLSGPTQSEDEVYVEANNQHLLNMSKQIGTLNQNQILGEFVGINKLCLKDYQQLIRLLDKNPALLHSGHYEEDGLVELSKHSPIYCLKIPDLLWCEIDNLFHLQRAKRLYEKICLQQPIAN